MNTAAQEVTRRLRGLGMSVVTVLIQQRRVLCVGVFTGPVDVIMDETRRLPGREGER